MNLAKGMSHCAVVGLCIAVAALAARGTVLGDNSDGAVEQGQLQRPGGVLRLDLLMEQGRDLVVDAPQTPAPAFQVAAGLYIEQEASAGEPSEGIQAPVTFYACYGPNGGYCVGPAGPLPLAAGQAACGEAWPMGAVLLIEGDPLGPTICNDRGHLAPHQVDRFFWREEEGWAWSAQVGSYARVERVGMRPSTP